MAYQFVSERREEVDLEGKLQLRIKRITVVCVWEAAELCGLGTAPLFRFFLFGFFFLDRIFLFQTENQEMWNPLEEDWCGG